MPSEPLKPLWRKIPDLSGYDVSENGDVRSWLAEGRKLGSRTSEPHSIVLQDRNGYRAFVAMDAGKARTVFVHKAVLLAFVGPAPRGHEARHLNGQSADNRLANLAWGTKAENESDKVKHGTYLAGSRSMRRKLTEHQVRDIRVRLTQGAPLATLGRDYGVTWQSIQAIAKGRSWKHLS